MKLLVCIEMRNGILFNHRRVSQDRVVTEDILKESEGKLWIGEYSRSLFKEQSSCELKVDDEYRKKAGSEEWCFVETELDSEIAKNTDELVVYQWNRRYPADTFMKLDLKEWEELSQEELKGFSHEKITKIRYRKK